MGRRSLTRAIVRIMEWRGEGGELGGEGELLRLLVLRVRRVGCRHVIDVVAILLWVLGLVMGRSVGGIGRLGRAFLRLVMMRVVLVLVWLWRVGHETCEFLGEVHGWLGRFCVGLAERVRDEVWHEHIVWVELRLRWRGRHRWRRGREMKALLPDLRFIGRRRIKGH
jgi:hypothetical protein